MAHDETTANSGPTKLVIRNIGLMLSGDINRPILDADTIVAENGRIAAIGPAKDLDLSRRDDRHRRERHRRSRPA